MTHTTRASAHAAHDGPPDEMRAAALLARRAGGERLYSRMVDAFGSAARERLASMREAAGAGQHAEVARLAHAMRGSAAQMGAHAVRDAATELEATTDDRRRRELLDELTDALANAERWLQALLEEAR